MNLAETVYLMVQKSMKAAQLTDLKVGTVTAVDPLEVTIDSTMQPIPSSILYLTEPVIEKKIPVLSHSHDVSGLSHTHTVSGLGHQHSTGGLTHTHTITDGNTGASLDGAYASDQQLTETYVTSSALSGEATSTGALGSIACIENGVTLPVENGYIILNRALAVGDKVLLLRVQNGQKFIVLSRIFEEVS